MTKKATNEKEREISRLSSERWRRAHGVKARVKIKANHPMILGETAREYKLRIARIAWGIWYERNKKEYNKKKKLYREINKVAYLAKQKLWKETHKEHIRAYERNKSAEKRVEVLKSPKIGLSINTPRISRVGNRTIHRCV